MVKGVSCEYHHHASTNAGRKRRGASRVDGLRSTGQANRDEEV
jgi:hypothetical protein